MISYVVIATKKRDDSKFAKSSIKTHFAMI